MEETDTINSYEKLTGQYADLFIDNQFYKCKPESIKEITSSSDAELETKYEWNSPSDVLLDKVDLSPPLTSKVVKGQTHLGILQIGDFSLKKQQKRFSRQLHELLADNDQVWMLIQRRERDSIHQRVHELYKRIFHEKATIMQTKIYKFYEQTLYELEKHLKAEVQIILTDAHCNIVRDLNKEIKEKLGYERCSLEKTLRENYNEEVRKLNKYYYLLLQNEKYRCNRLINQALIDRNDALRTFCNQIEAQTSTGTMYVMCAERRKCKMRQYMLESFHTKEIEEKLEIIKQKQNILDEIEKKKRHVSEINKEWQEKVKKILQLFLKFISFSLKLLPEQTTFLLDFEKLVVLQLNEIEKNPKNAKSLILKQEQLLNMFLFHKEQSECASPKPPCQPFTIEGDMSPSISSPYGSRETLPLDYDLKYVRLQRQFIYAKCQKMDEVKARLESRRCTCDVILQPQETKSSQDTMISENPINALPTDPPITSESSLEQFLVDDIQRLQMCPLRSCQNITETLSFPDINEYSEFSEEKLRRVLAILGPEAASIETPPELVDAEDIIKRKLLFPGKELQEPQMTRDAETQYFFSNQDSIIDVPCPCMKNVIISTEDKDFPVSPEAEKRKINAILDKRRNSFMELLGDNPNLLKLFTDENFESIE